MSMLRFAGRALFSSYFIADGYQMVAKPDKTTDQVSGTIDTVVPAVQSVLPPKVADKVPSDARTWTRILGIAQIVGGLAYATGWCRRPGAAILACATVPRVVSAAGQGASGRSELFSQLALLGGTVVATQDTAGRPGIAWRAEQSKRETTQHAQQARKAVEQRAQRVGKKATKKAKRAQKKAQRKAQAASKKAQAASKKVRSGVKDAVR